MNWAALLEHLQAVLKEFNTTVAPHKDLLIEYFRDGFKPSIHTQIDKQNRDLKN